MVSHQIKMVALRHENMHKFVMFTRESLTDTKKLGYMKTFSFSLSYLLHYVYVNTYRHP